MHPILLKIGPLAIYSYGLMVAAGFGTAVYLASAQAHKFGLRKESVVDISLCVLIAGLVGARILYVLLNLGFYRSNPIEVFYISHGGLVWYGAFLFGVSAALIYVAKKVISFWNTADLFAPYIALGQALGRIGCFLNGCCYGGQAARNFPFAVYFPEDVFPRHPTQIYSSLLLLGLFIALRYMQTKRRFAGEIFLAYAILYSLERFVIEFFRGDNPPVFLNLTISQVISPVVFAAAISAYIIFFIRWKNTHF